MVWDAWHFLTDTEKFRKNRIALKLCSFFSDCQWTFIRKMHKYPNVVPIPGSRNKERIVENLDAAQVDLTDLEFAELEDALAQCRIYGHRGFLGF